MAQDYSTLEDGTICVDLEIKNQKGLHARAAAAFVKCAEQFDADVTVERIGQEVSGCSIMGLMMLAAAKGTIIHVRAKGNQAHEAIEAVSNLVNCKFGED